MWLKIVTEYLFCKVIKIVMLHKPKVSSKIFNTGTAIHKANKS